MKYLRRIRPVRVAVLGTLFVWPFLAPGLLQANQVVFTEIMYHPPGTQPEYLEVQNLTATPLDLAEWRLRDGVDFDFPAFNAGAPAASFLKPFERIVLSSASEAVTRAAYPIPAGVRVFGPWTGALDNAGERITLKDKNGVVLCSVAYNDRGEWPVAADGVGHSLVLKNADRRPDDWRNWTFSARRLGTPGTDPVLQAETAVASPEVNLSAGVPFVNYGDSWRYHDQNIDLGTAWRAPGYDDSTWSEGPGLFGFETAPLPAPGIRSPFNNASQLTFYLRKKFVYQGSTAGVTLSVDQVIDDGAVYYLNGVEIGRSGVPGTPLTFTTAANRTVGDAAEELAVFSAPGSALVSGTNVLAVEVHQVSTTSSDCVFGARLNISLPSAPSLVINEVLPAGPGVGFIEIYNPGASAINLRNHYLTDDPANLTKFRVANDLVIAAGGLGSVGFTESGFSLTSPVKVYLVATNGTAIINAIQSSLAVDGRSLGRKPTGGASWFLFADATRNAPNQSQSGLAAIVRLNEVHFSTSNTVDWVEFYNLSDASVALAGLSLASRPDLTDRLPLAGSVPARSVISVPTAFPVAGGEVTLFIVAGADTVLHGRAFARSSAATSHQAFPDGANEWYRAVTSSRDATNNPARQSDIVINEVMYDPPSDEPGAEFIELYNRGAASVDLSGWRVADAVSFTFPPGTVLGPDGYLVVAANAAHLRSAYGAIPVVGDWDGRLANNGDRIRLLDALGNLADEVDYLPGGAWPNLANGDGTSMELRHPWMDNSLASAWQDSDETNKTSFASYRLSDVFRQLTTTGAATDYKELHFHLVGDSHVILRNIQLRLNGAGANLLVNTDRMSTNGASANGWLAQGTHYASRVAGGELHLIADGHGDNRANRVEIDATAMNANSTYEVSFDARWVAGASRLIVQTWDHSIASTFALPVPANLGTPGLRNSRFIAQPAPQVDQLLHSPAVPAAGAPVRITARITSPVAAPQVTLFHRLDNTTGSGVWSSKPMTDSGLNGDLVANDGLYSALLTEYGGASQIPQFYVVATANNQSSQMPKWGASRPAMYVVDTPSAAADLRRMRFVVAALDLTDLSGGNGPTVPNGYAFPRLANHYYNTTIILNEQEVIYNGEIRTSGSPWTRGGDLSRGKFKFPKDRLFRGKEKLSYDNDASGGSRHHNRIARYWLYLFGHPANENEYVNIEINAGGTSLREETEPLGNDMLDRIYGDGSQGELYRIDDEWWFTDDWAQQPSRNSDWSYKGTDNAPRYHTEWMKRTRENEYDYSSLIGLFRTISQGTYSQAQIERLLDPVAVTKMAAIRGYIGDWDSFSLNRGKNGYFYRRNTDGRFMFFHWDSDLAFQSTSEVFYNGMTGFRPWLEKPYNLRLFKHYLAQLVEGYTRNSPRINAWLQAEEDASTQYTVSTAYQTWFAGREGPALTLLGANRTNVFNITSNSGNPINTSAATVNLAGVAPLRAFRVEVAGHPEAAFGFSTESAWGVTNILLRTGVNTLVLNALDEWGNVLASDTIIVNKSGNAAPVLALDANPNSWRTSVLDPIELDASRSFDPDFLPLSFQWSLTPEGQMDTRGGDRATIYFPAPGLYTVRVTATDAAGGTNTIAREITVHAPDGFSSLGDARLEGFWRLENVALRRHHLAGPYYSLNEIAGNLTLQLTDDRAYPLGANPAAYPYVWRALPALNDWSFATKVGLRAQVYGDYMAGLLVEAQEGGAPVRYAFGIEDGVGLNVRRVAGANSTTLRSTVLNVSEIEIRIRRAGGALVFEQRTNDVWFAVHTASLPVGSTAAKAGLFLASDLAQRIKCAFDYAVLVDPSATSDLRQSLRFSEIMYNPIGGNEFEFVELANLGNTVLDLTGAKFTAGIDYTFGPTLLGPKQFLVVAKNPAAFASRYSTTGLNLAPDGFLGQLNNAGETLELSDSNNVVILSVTYGDSDPWPVDADGAGSSLEARTLTGNLNDPLSWRASPEANGSPGRAGGDALGTVVVNEVLTHTDPPLEDAIEVHNRTAQAVDIGGWYLSDSRADFRKFRIPPNTVVPAGGFRVFYEIEFSTNNPLIPFSLSSASGDQVHLSAADAAGNLTGYRSSVDFDAAANGVSFGRYETSQGPDFPALIARTFGAEAPADLTEFRTGAGRTNASPQVGPIILNEIHYRPPEVGGTNDNVLQEFIELHNVTAQPVPLFDPAAPTNTWRIRGGVDFDFPVAITLPPRGFAVIVSFDPQTNAAARAEFRTAYALPAEVPLFGPYSGRLDNGGEEIRLNRPDAPQPAVGTNPPVIPRLLVDRVVYSDSSPWPAGADGLGESLQRRRTHEYGNDPVNWRGLAPTPGRAALAPAGAFADTDADGLPDAYESARGFDVQNANDAGLDTDGDGRSNYAEFQDGTDPRNAADRLFAPAVTTSPSSQTLAAGSTASFTVAATGTEPLSYQWRLNGTALVGATNASLILPSIKASDRGEYSVVIANAAGFAFSAGAVLQVNQPLEILAQPQSRLVDRNGSVAFSVFAAGTGTLRYQWLFNDAPLAHATNATLTLVGVQPESAGNYAVVVADDSATITSASATLSVLSPPSILAQPQSKTAVAYNDTFLSVTAGGEGPFSYQWRFNGIPIADATNSILALPNVQPGQAGLYSVEIFNPVASVVSSNALLTLLIPATIVQQPQSTNVAPGGTATFTVGATSSTPLSYQWRFNDVAIPGATNTSYTLVNAQEENSGLYSVEITDRVGTIRSEGATLGIIIPLGFVQVPLSQSAPEGGSVTFSTEIRGGPLPYGIEWRRGSVPISSNTLFTTKGFFTLSNLTTADAAGYRVVIRTAVNPTGIGSNPLATLAVLADFDRDGLPDALEATLGLNTNNAADALLDLDQDGVSNRDEYRAGTDLQDPSSYLRLDAVPVDGAATIVFAASSNKTYTVEYSDDLNAGLWQKLDDLVARSTNHVRVLQDLNPRPQRFYRALTPRRP